MGSFIGDNPRCRALEVQACWDVCACFWTVVKVHVRGIELRPEAIVCLYVWT